MSANLVNHYVEEYSTNVSHLLQYRGTKFRSAVTEARHSGNDAHIVDQFGTVEAQEVVTRFEPMPRTDIDNQRVWLAPRDYDIPGMMIDRFDLLRTLTDPKGKYAEAGAMGMARKIDDIIVGAFFADIRKGTNGGTTEGFDTTNHRVDAAVGASADTGLNVEKILEARKLLQIEEVDLDMETCYLAIHPNQEHDLLRQEQVLSADKKGSLGIRTNEKGRIVGLLGCEVIVSTRVPSNSSYRLNPMWVRSGMHLGIWGDVRARADERDDLRGIPWQLYTWMSMAATRIEAGRVIQIESTE